MSHRRVAVALSILLTVWAPALAAAQTTTPAAGLTPWGDPDLQGIWTGQTFTPLQRPAHLAGRELFTEEEAAELGCNPGWVDPPSWSLRRSGAIIPPAERRGRPCSAGAVHVGF